MRAIFDNQSCGAQRARVICWIPRNIVLLPTPRAVRFARVLHYIFLVQKHDKISISAIMVVFSDSPNYDESIQHTRLTRDHIWP